MGKLELIIGCMFSSKTTTLISRIERLTIANKKCIILNHTTDNRYTSEPFVVSHGNIKYPAKKCRDLLPIQDELQDYDCIGIDEGQFFDDLEDFAELMANKGKIVIVAGLVSDFQRNKFGQISDLIPKADNITFLHAICSVCYNDNASISKRYDVNYYDCINQTMIGGSDIYSAICRDCYLKEKENV